MQDVYRNHGNKPSHSVKPVCVMTILKWSRHKLFCGTTFSIQACCFEEEVNHNAKTLDAGAENVLKAKFLGYGTRIFPFLNRFRSSS